MVVTTRPINAGLTQIVATEAARSYAATGSVVVTRPVADLIPIADADFFCVVAADRDVIELALDVDADWSAVRGAVDHLDEAISDVVVLVPGEAMGDAHAALYGAPAALQQWWFEGGVARFGRRESL